MKKEIQEKINKMEEHIKKSEDEEYKKEMIKKIEELKTLLNNTGWL